MALGALTTNARTQAGSSPVSFFDFSFAGDSSYPTGGTVDFEGTVQAKLGRQVEVLSVIPASISGYTPVYDKANDKLMMFRVGGADAAAATAAAVATADSDATYGSPESTLLNECKASINALITDVAAIRTALNALTDTPNEEVANGVNLSATTFRVVVVCR